MSQAVRVQAKSSQAEATRWFSSNPFDNPYVEAQIKTEGTGYTVYNLYPSTLKIDQQYTQPGQPQQVVHDGDYIVKRRESDYVEVYSPDEFARRFNVVQPDAVEFVPTTQEQLAPYQPPSH